MKKNLTKPKSVALPNGKVLLRKDILEGMVSHPSKLSIVADIVIYLVLILAMFISILPMWHTIMSSLSNGQLLIAHEGVAWGWITLDGKPNWAGYIKTINYGDFAILKSYGVTLMYVAGNVVFGLIINVLAAYAIYRKTRISKVLTLFIILTMMFSGGIIPTYMIINKIGFINTPWALMLPSCTNAMFVMLQLNAFRQVPESTIEAAEIDGASHLDVIFRVLLPQSVGLTVVILINTAILAWNAWFEASIYVTTNQDLWPLQLWIRQLVADNANIINVQTPDWNKYLVSYGVILITTLPVLVIMPFIQKQIQKGALIGAVKE